MIAAWMLLALAAVPARSETRHTVVPRDTMWDLALRYYDDNFQWRRIAEANPPPDVHDPHWIYPGQVLIIPDGKEEAPPPEPEEPAAEPVPEAPAVQPVAFKPDSAAGAERAADSLSTRFPEGLVAAPPSSYRLKALPGWAPDGSVTGLEGSEIMAAEGDPIDVVIDKGAARSGDRFQVFRKGGPAEEDADKAAAYVVKVGLIQLRKPVGAKTWRALILKSVDALQIGDVIVRGE